VAGEHFNLADLMEDNRLLRQAIAEARRHLDSAAASLREVLDDEVFVVETPMEVEAAMESAGNAIAAATRSLQQPSAHRSTSPIPGGPTRQQGQFLAYIREYMLRNHLGLAPTHAELQQFFNLTPPSVNSMLKRLDQRGFIRRIPGKARAIELTINPELIPPLDRPFKQ
jgi:repressor LexA